MGRRGNKAALYESAGEPTHMREALERRWQDRLTAMPHLATLVTAELAQREPFHRWMNYKQGFSPGLVRQFLNETSSLVSHDVDFQVLDPFSGSGTTAIECAKRKVKAIGIDTLPWLIFLTRMTGNRTFPPLPDVDYNWPWEQIADVFTEDIHRAALMVAIARQYTSAGKINKGARPLASLLEQMIATIQEDLSAPLPMQTQCGIDNALTLSTMNDNSCGSVLCSPPYLSQHNYRKIASPYEKIYQHWFKENNYAQHATNLIASHPNAPTKEKKKTTTHLAESEACNWLREIGENKIARITHDYFYDLKCFLRATRRVLVDGAPCWIVIGGARPKGIYIPSDLILAEIAEKCGFTVESISVARDLVSPRRKFGHIGHVAPRESVLILSAS